MNRRSPVNERGVKLGIVALTIRWVAKAWTIASIGLVLLILVGELLLPHAPLPMFRDLAGLFFFPFGVCVGMLLAWRWEALGGAITVGSLLALYGALHIMDGRFPRGPYFALIAGPGFLFPLSSAITIATQRKKGP